MHTALWLVPLILLCLSGLTGCGGTAGDTTASTDTGSAPAREQHFIFNNGAEPEYLDPGKATGSPGIRLINQLFEGLTTLDPKTLEPLPGMAERWDIDEAGTTWTFHLRANAKWSDGSPLTADDFRRSWLRVLNPATGAKYATQLYLIEGAEARHQGGSEDAVGITVIDDHTLQVRLRGPAPYFLELLAFTTYMPVPAEPIAAHGDAWTQADTIIGNGPFVLAEWAERERIVLVPNEHYHGRDSIRLERITALPHENIESVYQQYLSGAVHWINSVPASKIAEVKRHPDFYTAPFLASYYYRFNCTVAPFNDVRVRRALTMAIDRQYLVDNVTALGEIPATAFTPPMAQYQPPNGLGYDPEGAKKLLAEVRSEGVTIDTVEILFNDRDTHRKIAEAIAQMWRETLGIEVAARGAEWKSYMKSMDQLDYQIVRSSWVGDYSDPYTFLSCFRTDDGNNRTGWTDPAYDTALDASQLIQDPAKRAAAYTELEQRLLAGQPIAPIYVAINKGLKKPFVRGLHQNIRDLLYCRSVYLED
ncbi:MAG: peptide ABC transporter substrate-binding protein [Planctomycetota bacterium]|nr:peptide ABC transporter substrate-binding protein [Planctomycetota bacterium]